MSGEDLKQAAIQGKHKLLCSVLKDRANACSADEYGLTALMYACWNGHVESVKYLAANPMGIDSNGKRRSCVDLVSCKGYTAMHITALDAPEKSAPEIIKCLLMLGADQTIRCREDQTAYEIALKLGKTSVMRAFNDYNTQDENIGLRMEMDDLKRELKSKFTFYHEPKMIVEPWDADFEIPKFLYEPQRAGAIAPKLTIHENQILSLAEEGFYNKDGSESLHCLSFAKEQARINRERRADLISAGDPGWELPKIPEKKLARRRKCAKRSKEDNYLQPPTASNEAK